MGLEMFLILTGMVFLIFYGLQIIHVGKEVTLTGPQIDLWNQQGFVLVKDTLDLSDTQPVIDEVTAFIEQRTR